ncbi:MAG TPA: T9SS type A sorting domain-containing protein [Flavobacteriales bacterium]
MMNLSPLLLVTPFLFLAPDLARAQCNFTSTTGYTVHVKVQPIAIQADRQSCPYGYNYTTRLSYEITFSGTNIPASLSTLQGTISCNGTSQFFDLPNNGGSGQVVSANTWSGLGNCATANPVTMNCNTLYIEIQGPGLSARTVLCPTTAVVLPITLLHFDAEVKRGEVELSWATASEKDNALFTVERSTDAVDFTPVTSVPGAGNSNAALFYLASDPAPLPGVSYYRLKQTDTDGTSTWSDVLPITIESGGADPIISPNPAKDDVFRILGNIEGCSMQVRSLTGALLFELPVAQETVAHPPLPSGVYVVYLMPTSGGAGRTVRLVQD